MDVNLGSHANDDNVDDKGGEEESHDVDVALTLATARPMPFAIVAFIIVVSCIVCANKSTQYSLSKHKRSGFMRPSKHRLKEWL
mmetsp:Transcript_5225/g.8259  ORF Transcript_5225/g.8259 Transcript_5225/m.8259 type:complete len:84 (+) Transcript_5225:610-861(+)